jgi:hypothetical protein
MLKPVGDSLRTLEQQESCSVLGGIENVGKDLRFQRPYLAHDKTRMLRAFVFVDLVDQGIRFIHLHGGHLRLMPVFSLPEDSLPSLKLGRAVHVSCRFDFGAISGPDSR